MTKTHLKYVSDSGHCHFSHRIKWTGRGLADMRVKFSKPLVLVFLATQYLVVFPKQWVRTHLWVVDTFLWVTSNVKMSKHKNILKSMINEKTLSSENRRSISSQWKEVLWACRNCYFHFSSSSSLLRFELKVWEALEKTNHTVMWDG